MKKYSIEEIAEKAEKLSYIPIVVAELITMVTGSNIEVQKIINTIRKDQGLVARIFKIANSAYYGRLQKAEHLSEAVITLGLRGLKSIVLTEAAKHVLTAADTDDHFFWEHAVKVSVASAVFAGELSEDIVDDAVVSGLMHDIGKALIGSVYPGIFLKIREMVEKEGALYKDVEQSIFNFDHTAVGAAVAEKWNFPQKLIDVIRYHHSSNEDEISVSEVSKELIDIVSLANRVSHLHENELEEKRDSFRLHGIPKERMKKLIEDIKRDWGKKDSLYF
jgi:putative nucleotidyltransferase with HDIG domain